MLLGKHVLKDLHAYAFVARELVIIIPHMASAMRSNYFLALTMINASAFCMAFTMINVSVCRLS